MAAIRNLREVRRGGKFKGEHGALKVVWERAWSYDTCIRDVLPDGRSIGNDTKYSMTTSHHQSAVGVRSCDVVVSGVPQGTSDLAAWYAQEKES